MEIPIELIEQIEKGNCVLFLGWSPPDTDALSERILAQRLAERVQYSDPLGPLYKVAEYFETERGSQALVQYVCDVVEEYSDRPPKYYDLVADLPFNIIVSTSLDDLLKRVLQTKGKRYVQVIKNEEVSFIDDSRLLLVKLYGDVENKSSLIITEENYLGFFDEFENLSDLLKFYFRTKTLLFVGHSLDDPHFRQLYAHANQRTKGYQRRAFAVKTASSPSEVRVWQQRNLTILDMDIEDFLLQLKQKVRIKHLPPKDSIASEQPSGHEGDNMYRSPYKFLSSYEEQDFFW